MSVFRYDRSFTLYCVHPLRQLLSLNTEPAIPILMYHSISANEEMDTHPYFQVTTSPHVFAEQIKFLHDEHYSVINLRTLNSSLSNKKNAENKKQVVLTFDDGFHDFYTEAYPILQRYGFSATIFLPTAFIGNQRLKFNNKNCLIWEEIQELHKRGFDFGSHTHSHPILLKLKKDTIEMELKQSKQIIEDKIGQSVTSFSYPYAFPETRIKFKQSLRESLIKFGYLNCVTTIIGCAGKEDDNFFLKRIPINSKDDLSFFRAKLKGSYDWLHKIQYLSKMVGK